MYLPKINSIILGNGHLEPIKLKAKYVFQGDGNDWFYNPSWLLQSNTFNYLMLTALYTTIYMYDYKTCFEHINCQYLTNKVLLKINYVNLHDPQINYVYMTLCCLTDIDLYQKIHYAIYRCLLGYICSFFSHTLDRLVRGYKLSRFCTLPPKSRRFIAREQKLVYCISKYIIFVTVKYLFRNIVSGM